MPEAAYSRAILGACELTRVELDRADVHSLIADELRRLHEGVLARYGLQPSEFAAWRAQAGG